MAKRLTRSTTDRMIAGVCGGLGEYLNIDPTLIRLAFAGAFFLGLGSPGLFYLLLWLIVPLEGNTDETPRATVEANVQEMGEKARQMRDEVRERVSPEQDQ